MKIVFIQKRKIVLLEECNENRYIINVYKNKSKKIKNNLLVYEGSGLSVPSKLKIPTNAPFAGRSHLYIL